jgi:hypothetical protein
MRRELGEKPGSQAPGAGPAILLSKCLEKTHVEVKVFDPCVNNSSLLPGKEPGRWQAASGSGLWQA